MPAPDDAEENGSISHDGYTDDESGVDGRSPLLHIRDDQVTTEDGHSFPVPLWMRDSASHFQGRWIPTPIRKAARATVRWVKGPEHPRIFTVKPFLPAIQEAPIRLLDRYAPKRRHRIPLLLAFYGSWLLTWSLVLHRSNTSGRIEGYGTPTPIWCGANYWSRGNRCGLDGNNCRPFDNATFTFKCPAFCKRMQVLEPYAVGDQQLLYEPLVVGGPAEEGGEAIYRADSFLCQAAIHAGVVSNEKGGCGVVELAGEHDDFKGSKRHGIKSASFPSTFPKSYRFVTGLDSECAKDLRWPLLAVTVIWTTILSLTTTSPSVFFFSIFTMLFLHVGLVSDKPDVSDPYALASIFLGRFLPAAFIGSVVYRYCARPQLKGLTAQVEKTVLYLGGAWVGALNNYTFDYIPISRLTPHDIKQQPGAVLSLVLIVVSLLAIAIGQVFYLRLAGLLPRYLALYATFVLGLIVCVAIPGLNLRIHHYILSLLLIPGTALQTRPALLYQGILIGLFVNGIARWGFDSIMQTPAALLGDGQLKSLLPPITALASSVSNITFAWPWPPPDFYDGISVLVNDVERWRSYVGEDGDGEGWTYVPRAREEAAREEGKEVFFRFAWMAGSDAGDYTKAGVWEVDGSWKEMKPGPSR